MKTSILMTLVSLMAFPLAALAKAAPTTKPATRAAASKPAAGQTPEAKANAAVANAITVLKKEYAEHQKDPVAPVRKTSDYFAQNADGEVTVEAILTALERRVGDDAKMDGYIKWQLLSGVKGKVDPKLGAKAVGI